MPVSTDEIRETLPAASEDYEWPPAALRGRMDVWFGVADQTGNIPHWQRLEGHGPAPEDDPVAQSVLRVYEDGTTALLIRWDLPDFERLSARKAEYRRRVRGRRRR